MTEKDLYGCACCSPEFGKIFHTNRKVMELSAQGPPSIALETAQHNGISDIDRRGFLKGALAAASFIGLMPGEVFAKADVVADTNPEAGAAEFVTVFYGGTILRHSW